MTNFSPILQFLEVYGDTPKRLKQGGAASPTLLGCSRTPLEGNSLPLSAYSSRPELVEFWSEVGMLRLFVDTEYGQWGLVTLSPKDCIRLTAFERKNRPTDFKEGDLIVAEFLGDLDKTLVAADGSVRICQPLDGRESWPMVGMSFDDFLLRFITTNGVKFWD